MASGSLASRSVDIAVLSNDISRPVVLDDSVTVIDLAPICPPLSISNFMKMFYKNGPAAKFSMLNDTDALSATSQIGDGTYSSLAQNNYAVSETGLVAIPLNDYVSFSGQTLEGAGGNNSAFDLKKAILGAYSSNESGVGVDSNCWAPCSLMAIQTQMNKLKHLYDICNVECSRTFYEAMQEVSSLFDCDGGSSVINTRVSVVFTNQNPVVQDVIVRFNFQVELLCVNAKPMIDTPLSSLYDGIDNVPVFRGGELIGSQPLQSALKRGNPVSMDFQKGADSLAYFFNKSVRFVGQKSDSNTGPSSEYWSQVLTSNCLPPCFPFDVASGEIYVLSVCHDLSQAWKDLCAEWWEKYNAWLDAIKAKNRAAMAAALTALYGVNRRKHAFWHGRPRSEDDKCDPMPIILPPGHKLASSGAKATTQSCASESVVVANLYIDLSCGKKSKYFPGDKGFGKGYDGIDPSDVFLAPAGGFSFTANESLGKISDANGTAYTTDGSCVPGGVELDLSSATLTDAPPSCVGDYYLLSTQVNQFLQHVHPCNDEHIKLQEVSPIQCITVCDDAAGAAIGEAIVTSIGSQPDNVFGSDPQTWGLGHDHVVPKLSECDSELAYAFTLDELACKPFAVVITDVCALPPKPGQDLF